MACEHNSASGLRTGAKDVVGRGPVKPHRVVVIALMDAGFKLISKAKVESEPRCNAEVILQIRGLIVRGDGQLSGDVERAGGWVAKKHVSGGCPGQRAIEGKGAGGIRQRLEREGDCPVRIADFETVLAQTLG